MAAASTPGLGGVEDATPLFVISVAAQLSGLHPQTLRQYDRLGLVTPGRAAGRGRRYSARDVAVLREVQRLSQDEGVSLAGIKRILALEDQVDALRSRVADLAAELDTYQQRDSTLDYQGRQSTRTQEDVTARLAGVNAEIAAYTAILATPNLTDTLRKQNESKLRRAKDRQDNLTERGTSRAGATAFLAAVDADQIASQVAVLTGAQTQVATRKAALPA